MVTILTGIVGGLVATLVMTIAMMMFGDDSPPPTAQLWAKYVGDKTPDQYMMQGMVLHFLYGAGAGAVMYLVADAVGLFGLGAAVGWIVWGVVWAIALFVFAAVFWMNAVLGMDADMDAAVTFGGFHLVYGVVLGLWLGIIGFP